MSSFTIYNLYPLINFLLQYGHIIEINQLIVEAILRLHNEKDHTAKNIWKIFFFNFSIKYIFFKISPPFFVLLYHKNSINSIYSHKVTGSSIRSGKSSMVKLDSFLPLKTRKVLDLQGLSVGVVKLSSKDVFRAQNDNFY